MANASENQACSFFATIFAQLLAGILSDARGEQWRIALAEPPSDRLPTIDSPVHYCLRFGEHLKGACYAGFSQSDVALFGGSKPDVAKDTDVVADEAAMLEESAAALLALLRTLALALPKALAASHALVSVVAERVEALDPRAEFALELKATSGEAAGTVILLHFDPDLLDSLAAAALHPAVTPNVDQGVVQANLGLVMDVELNCTLRFGQRQLTLREILDLASGSVVELDRQVDEPVELILDGRVIARGEAVIIDGNYGLRVTQVLHTLAY